MLTKCGRDSRRGRGFINTPKRRAGHPYDIEVAVLEGEQIPALQLQTHGGGEGRARVCLRRRGACACSLSREGMRL